MTTTGTTHRAAAPIDVAVMARQTRRLAADLRTLTGPTWEETGTALAALGGTRPTKVCLIGDGDSYHAARAAEMAFETLGGTDCEPLSAQRFLDYHVDLPAHTGGAPLVVGVSSSGRTERVLQGVARARARGLATIAVTGAADSPLARAAAAAVTVAPPDPERSPGIRTYQASLLALLLLAVRLGGPRGSGRPDQVAEIASLASAVDATERALQGPCEDLGRELAAGPVIAVLGSGPGEGTAKYCAAKLVEGAGAMAFGQDLEEWWHVERFAAPLDMPLLVLAPPGGAHDRAVDLAARAAALGRRVVAVLPEGAPPLEGPNLRTVRVHGTVREEFSPLLYHLFAGHLATGLARHTGRLPFQSHRAAGPAGD
ncbi:glucosamine--fructose-6-phosphate aminotransferase (isomerizing) [Streptomyces sp. TLI_235]|nr:SIS domain-containing protein [Streptomyces sp. TLI_235]PBC78958.1 glucosamine--fructose-6-phosphate aminotransferase (isomerizing) [Streptomyces sp. TLI_235]